MQRGWSERACLYAPGGSRKYLNRAERDRALAEMAKLPPSQALFALTLAWSGGRVSEILALTAASFQTEAGIIAIETLKRRGHHVREVRLPPDLMTALNRHFKISALQRDKQNRNQRLWPWHRVTAWRIIKRVMHCSSVAGPQACPKGLRHGFGIGAIQAGVPLNLTQRWLGHARLSTTAIYAAASGPEELFFMEQFWRGTSQQHRLPPAASHQRSNIRDVRLRLQISQTIVTLRALAKLRARVWNCILSATRAAIT